MSAESTPVTRHDYLCEVGCEELPAGFLATVESELRTRLETLLTDLRLPYDGLDIYLTPRRIAFIVKQLASKQPPSEEWVKGPPVSVAKDANGQLTPAARGFAKKQGVAAESMTEREIDGATYLSFLKQDAGQTVADLFAAHLPAAILSLPGSHFMRWDVTEEGVADVAFSRPIRWVVSLLDSTELPLTFGPLKSGRLSEGHRFLATPRSVAIDSAQGYLSQMETAGFVLADHRRRRDEIASQLEKLAVERNIRIPEQAELLDHVTFLVECPKPVMGEFASHYLELPKPVVTTVMTAHQKYFHALQPAGETLVPGFVTISNNPLPDAEATIQSGNEKVLRARLEDASFFFQEDRKKPLDAYVEALKGITFQKNLGTLADKTHRLVALTPSVGALCGSSASVISESTRAALLCKADLATLMVRELTELQGTIGEYYARLSGESEAVSKAIDEHYLPRFAGDAIAPSDVGTLLSVVDKLDTLMAVFSQKDLRVPTGSKDPMGLRRLCLGLIVTVLEKQLPLNLDDALRNAYANLEGLASLPVDDAISAFQAFFEQRLKGYFLDQGHRFDVIEAAFLADVSPLESLLSCQKRITALKSLFESDTQLKQVYEPANRVAKILGAQYDRQAQLETVSESLLENDAERNLLVTLREKLPLALSADTSLDAAIPLLLALEPAVAAFFNDTLVNADDAAVKQNRYVMLSALNQAYRRLADWTKLAI